MESHLCRIDEALGRERSCPGEACPLWDDAPRSTRSPATGLPELLLRILQELGGPPGVDYALLPPGLR